MSKHKCLICGAAKEPEKRDCGQHTYEEYKKVKSKVRNDPWPYFPISLVGFVIMLLGLSHFVPAEWNEQQIWNVVPLILILSIAIPVSLSVLLHNYRQKKKGLPFWGLTDEQEFTFVAKSNEESK